MACPATTRARSASSRLNPVCASSICDTPVMVRRVVIDTDVAPATAWLVASPGRSASTSGRSAAAWVSVCARSIAYARSNPSSTITPASSGSASPIAVEVCPLPVAEIDTEAAPALRSAPCGENARAMLSAPRPNTASVPASPRSSAVPSRISTICAPVRLGKALASSAAAPLITGAEKDVPDHKNAVPASSGATTR